jgi:hypothetical protein
MARRYCRVCSKRGRPKPLGASAPFPYTRTWPAFFGLVGHNLTEPGQTATIAIPKLDPEMKGRVIMSWGERAVVLRAECGDVAFKQAGAAYCDQCSGRVSSREHRTRAAATSGDDRPSRQLTAGGPAADTADPVVAPTAPATEQEFDVVAAATPASSPAPADTNDRNGASAGTVRQEFGA